MSALRRNNKIQIAMQLRWQLCVLAVPAAVLSALSISVFCHMRAFADVEKYYSGELSGLPANSLEDIFEADRRARQIVRAMAPA